MKNKERVQDSCLIAGSILLTIGLWLITPSLAFITLGAGLIWFGYPSKEGGK